jgi:hypothetical protein
MSKAEELFKEWLFNKNILADFCVKYQISTVNFYDLPQSMQWGVYLEFFDEQGIFIEVSKVSLGLDVKVYRIKINSKYVTESEKKQWITMYNTLAEAQEQAIKKAFELLNERLK